jgi:hypothetical protein
VKFILTTTDNRVFVVTMKEVDPRYVIAHTTEYNREYMRRYRAALRKDEGKTARKYVKRNLGLTAKH